MSAYTIAFSQRTTVATCLSPSIAHFASLYDAPVFFLKAQSTDRRSRQHVGYAVVVSPKQIIVLTANGTVVDTVASRADAATTIDAYHRAHNAADYWMWIDDTLLVRGKAVA